MLPKADPTEKFMSGQIVAVKGGKITKNTEGANQLMVISRKPIVLGNASEMTENDRHEKVAFLGQVPVVVRGEVTLGDYILPDGLNMGIGVAVNPAKMKAEDYKHIVGIAWSTSQEGKSLSEINVAVGLNGLAISQEVDKQNEEKEDKLILGGVEIQSRQSDCYINATQLCKAGRREFKKWNENESSKAFVEVLGKKLELPRTQLIESITTGTNEERITWVHPRIAIQIAQWVSSEFALNVSEWIEKLLTIGSVSIGRPVRAFYSLTEIDSEAIELEKKVCIDEFTRYSTIYVAYIGRGLVKVGFSDGNIIKRNFKHFSSESQYPEFRIIKLIRVSGQPMERDVHKDLYVYQVNYNRQKEVFKPPTTLSQFVFKIENFLYHHDILLRYDDLYIEHQKLKTQFEKSESECKILRIKLWALENKIDIPNDLVLKGY
jgi:hypothetical protein